MGGAENTILRGSINVQPQIYINELDEALPAFACGLHLLSEVVTSIALTQQLLEIKDV